MKVSYEFECGEETCAYREDYGWYCRFYKQRIFSRNDWCVLFSRKIEDQNKWVDGIPMRLPECKALKVKEE